MKRPRPSSVLWILPGGIALLLFAVLPHFPGVTEWIFARGLFRIITVPVGFLTSLLPFSLTELLVIAAVPLAVWLIVHMVRKYRRCAVRGALTRSLLRKTAWVLSSLFALYAVLHGLNFYRMPIAELMQLDTRQQDAAFLQRVVQDLAEQASAERVKLPEDADGHLDIEASRATILKQASAGFTAAQQDYPFLWGSVWHPKPVQLSHWWSYTGVTGMYFPFFAEANVNIDPPVFNMPATAAHELAHTRGFAREDECNFLAFLTCRYQDDPLYRYSGHLLAYIYCSNALYDYDEDMWQEARASCSEAMRRDLKQQKQYWKQFEGEVEQVSTSVNNAFITAHGDEDGVLSYDRVVQLILAYYQTVVWAE